MKQAGYGPKWHRALQAFDKDVERALAQASKGFLRDLQGHIAVAFDALAKASGHEYQKGSDGMFVAKEYLNNIFPEGVQVDEWGSDNFFRQGYDYMEPSKIVEWPSRLKAQVANLAKLFKGTELERTWGFGLNLRFFDPDTVRMELHDVRSTLPRYQGDYGIDDRTMAAILRAVDNILRALPQEKRGAFDGWTLVPKSRVGQGGKVAADKPLTGPDTRKAYYAMSDGLWAMKEEMRSNPVLRRDRKLHNLVYGAEASVDKVLKHLNAHYIWD